MGLAPLLQDLRYGLRVLSRGPGFALIAVLALALGIGANSALFSVVNALLLRPLDFPAPDRLVAVTEVDRSSGQEGSVCYPNFRDWRAQSQTLAAVGVFLGRAAALTGTDEPLRVTGAYATADVFTALGTEPQLGRTFAADEDRVGGPAVVVLAHALWRSRFAADPEILGKAISLDGRSFTVIGVMPPTFRFPLNLDRLDFFAPLSTVPSAAEAFDDRSRHFLQALARLQPGASLAQAQQELSTIARNLEAQYPGTNGQAGIRLEPLQRRLTGDLRPALMVLMCAVGFVLLITCANVANLLLARSSARQREIAIRVALGASRGRLIRQLLTESLLLSLTGGALGLLIAVWGKDLLLAASARTSNLAYDVPLDGMVLGFTGAVAVLTGLVFGLAPALNATRPQLHATIQAGGGALSSSIEGRRLQRVLVVTQTALALVLLVGAGLMIRSMARLADVDPGFRAEGVVTVKAGLPDARYDRAAKLEYYRRVLGALEALPGVASAAAISQVPFGGSTASVSFQVEGRPPPEPGSDQNTVFSFASASYFATLGIPLRQGQLWRAADEGSEQGLRPLVINETLARRFFAGEDPVGRAMTVNRYGRFEIVGVVGDVKHRTLDAPAPPQAYAPYGFHDWPNLSLLVRSKAGPEALFGDVRTVMREADPALPVPAPRLMDALVADSTFARRTVMVLLAVFAAVALGLSAIGIYGVIAYWVAQRARELAIRMALGAQARAVLRLVVGEGLRLSLIGVAVGIVLSLLVSRFLGRLLYGVHPMDPLTYGAIALVLSCVALLASYLPARRASKIHPMVTLRSE